MAKISGKGSALGERSLLRLLQRRESVRMELENLDALVSEQKAKALMRRVAPAKRALNNTASGRRKLAQQTMERKIQAYDVRAYLAQRKVNHGTAKAIFAALRSENGSKDITPVLKKQEARIQALTEKRTAYVADLQRHLNTTLPERVYEKDALAAEAALEASYEQQLRRLDQVYAEKRANTEKALRKELDGIEGKLAHLAENQKAIALPEDVLLRVRGLKMYFGGLKAVDDLSFDVKKGEIFGLIGPNGAGKTTVFNCITRFYNATGGDLFFVGRHGCAVDLRRYQVHDVILHGIVRTFQNVEVIREVSVLENLLIAGHRQYGSSLTAQALHLPVLRKEERLIRERALKVLDFMGLSEYKDWYAFGLPYGVLKRIEIARTLMCDPQLIILDEPAAGLNDTETAELAKLIRRIRDEYHCTILLVEHDMGLVMDICDTVCAISFGKLLAIGTPEQVQADKNVQTAYLGVGEEG